MTPPRLTSARLVTLVLVAALLAVSSCGRKGDPIRPGDEPEQEESS